MQTMTQDRSSAQLVELDRKIDDGFAKVDERFKGLEEQIVTRKEIDWRFTEVNKRLERVDERIEQMDSRVFAMSRSIVIGAFALSSSLIAGFGVFAAVIASKL